MHLSSIISAIVAAAGATMVSAQEAARFGIVTTTVPSGLLSPNESIAIKYNSTLAANQPIFIDFIMQGGRSNGFALPTLLISRNTYGADQKLLLQNATVPDFSSFGDNVTYVLWASVTFNVDGITEIGGVSTPDPGF